MTPNNPSGNSNNKMKQIIPYNIVVVGSAGVGKSSMISRFTTGDFDRGYTPTIEEKYRVDYQFNNITYRISVLDTMGHRDRAEVLESHTIDQHGALIVFDLGDENSFKIAELLADKLSMVFLDEPILLVGNKSDTERKVTEEEVEELMDNYPNIRDFMECSAQTDYSTVVKVFKDLLEYIIEERPQDVKTAPIVQIVQPSEVDTRGRRPNNPNSTISPQSNSSQRRNFNSDQPTIIRSAVNSEDPNSSKKSSNSPNLGGGNNQNQHRDTECRIM